ncbi:hypothetical protein MRX96_004400 [Rhipicephalus microplus]
MQADKGQVAVSQGTGPVSRNYEVKFHGPGTGLPGGERHHLRRSGTQRRLQGSSGVLPGDVRRLLVPCNARIGRASLYEDPESTRRAHRMPRTKQIDAVVFDASRTVACDAGVVGCPLVHLLIFDII